MGSVKRPTIIVIYNLISSSMFGPSVSKSVFNLFTLFYVKKYMVFLSINVSLAGP